MIRDSRSFPIFMGTQISEFLSQNTGKLQETIEHAIEDEVININEADYVSYLVDKFKVDAPIIDFENISISSYEKQIPAEQFPPGFYVRSGKSYPKQVVVYHLPFIGNEELFRYTPSQFMLWSPEVYISNRNVCFEILYFSGDIEEIKREAQRSIDAIKFFSNGLLQDVGNYDAQLRGNVEQIVKARKQRILDGNSLISALGKPIKKQGDLPQVPAPGMPSTRTSSEISANKKRASIDLVVSPLRF